MVVSQNYDVDHHQQFPLPPTRSRFDFCTILPVLVVWFTIIMIYSTYFCYHLLPQFIPNFLTPRFEEPLENLPMAENEEIDAMYAEGTWQCIVFHVLFALVVYCYLRTSFTDPGTIPEDPAWTYSESSDRLNAADVNNAGNNNGPPVAMRETKRGGERRHCKWCRKYKPDRAHHCRTCGRCVLKMDHHCPWLYNCVGFRNHKFFVLLLFYSVCCVSFVCVTFMWSVIDVVQNPLTHVASKIVVVVVESVAILLTIVLSGFFGFHVRKNIFHATFKFIF